MSMKKINWKIRLQSKIFVVSLLGLFFLLTQQVLAIFGISWDFTALNDQLNQVINTIFLILALVGVVKDPTTPGLEDSKKAMEYKTIRNRSEE
mgnify:CR=1 FL=1